LERRSDDASAGRGIAVFASLRALALAYRSERVTAEDRVVGRSLNARKKPGLMDRDLPYLPDIGANALTCAWPSGGNSRMVCDTDRLLGTMLAGASTEAVSIRA
jgi:hypothetical protein